MPSACLLWSAQHYMCFTQVGNYFLYNANQANLIVAYLRTLHCCQWVASSYCDWLNLGHPYSVEISSPRDSSYGDEYTVTWEKPIDGGLPITAYEFKYRRVCVCVCLCVCVIYILFFLFNICHWAAKILSRIFFYQCNSCCSSECCFSFSYQVLC